MGLRKDNRKHKRISLLQDILIDGTTSSNITDISENGLFVCTLQYFEPDSIISVTLPLKDEKVTVKAQVKYCQHGIGIGIMFIDLNNEQKAKIKEFVTKITGISD